MFKKFVIITTASLVCACADGEPEQEEQTEQTKHNHPPTRNTGPNIQMVTPRQPPTQ